MAKPDFTWHLTSKDVAFVAVFAALYAALGHIPLFYLFGSYGLYMTASLIVAPIMGIVMGPVGGTLATAIGGIIGMMTTGNMPMGVFSFLPGTMNALCVGLTVRDRWYASAAIFGIAIVAFAALPSVGSAKYFVWLHALALMVLMSPASKLAVKYVRGTDPQELVLGVGILVFIGVLIDHIVGSLIFQLLTPLPESVWEAVAFVYPVERLLVTVVATIIGTGLVRGTKMLGQQMGGVIG